MKTQIRSGVFETNSSSTHSIAIPKECEAASTIYFNIGEFGWEFEEANPADYFYTALCTTSRTEAEYKDRIRKLESILKKHNINYMLGEVKSHIAKYDEEEYFCINDGYIDHSFELVGFVNELLNDEDKLIRFISSGLVFTGNDNDDRDGFIDRNVKELEHYNWRTQSYYKEENPYYMENHEDYDWYYKGN